MVFISSLQRRHDHSPEDQCSAAGWATAACGVLGAKPRFPLLLVSKESLEMRQGVLLPQGMRFVGSFSVVVFCTSLQC